MIHGLGRTPSASERLEARHIADDEDHTSTMAIKAGRTREGSVAVSSHTGLLVDQAAMATAMYRKARELGRR